MTNDLPEFVVTLTMARKTGSLHTDVEYRTFSLRGPAIDAKKAEDIAYGLGHGINDATDHAWKFHGRSDCITVEPAAVEQTEVEQLRAVIEAAKTWRRWHGNTNAAYADACEALTAAVDALSTEAVAR